MERSGRAKMALSIAFSGLLFLCAAFFCIGAFLVAASVFQYWGFSEAVAHGAQAKAQVRSLKEVDLGYSSDVSWIDQAGVRRTDQISLSKAYVLSNGSRLAVEGSTVRYLENNSWIRPVVVGDEDERRSIIWSMLKFGGVMVGGSIAVGGLVLLAHWMALRLESKAEIGRAAHQSQLRAEEARSLLARLPFQTVIVSGQDALATWERLRAEGRGYPVILGGEEDVARLFEAHELDERADMAAAAEVLQKGQALRHPEDLQAKRRADEAHARESLAKLAAKGSRFEVPSVVFYDAEGRQRKQPDEETRAQLLREPEENEPPLGEWPEKTVGSAGLSVAWMKERVVVALLPVRQSHEVLGYLLYGNWNNCPSAEYHVAAQRSWSERYGAEIVGVTGDTLNLRVARKPATRDEALELVREHYIYCNDVIDQGFGTRSNLAAQLMLDRWWYFWWD